MEIKFALTRQSFILEIRESIHYRARTITETVGLPWCRSYLDKKDDFADSPQHFAFYVFI